MIKTHGTRDYYDGVADGMVHLAISMQKDFPIIVDLLEQIKGEKPYNFKEEGDTDIVVGELPDGD